MDAVRRYRSLRLWGALLQGNTWPQLKPGHRREAAHPEPQAADEADHAGAAAGTSQSAAGAARSDRLNRAIEDRIQLTAQSNPKPSDTADPSDAPPDGDAAAHETATARWKRASAVALDEARRERHGHDGEPMTLERAQQMASGCAEMGSPPLLDLDSPAGLLGWFVGRECIVRYGARYKDRIDRYVSIFWLVVVVLLAVTAVLVVYVDAHQASLHYIILTVTLFVQLAAPLLLAVYMLVNANGQIAKDQTMLAYKGHAILQELQKIDEVAHPAEAARARRCVDTIESVASRLAILAGTSPITLLGIEMSAGVFTSLLTLAAAVVPLIGANLVPLFTDTFAGPFPWDAAAGNGTSACGQ